MLDPLLSLYGIIHVTWYTRLLPKATSGPTKSRPDGSGRLLVGPATSVTPVVFGIPDHVTYQTPPRHAQLGSGRPPKTKLNIQRVLVCQPW